MVNGREGLALTKSPEPDRLPELGIGGDDFPVLKVCLCDEQTVRQVLVMQRQTLQRQRVRKLDGQDLNPLAV